MITHIEGKLVKKTPTYIVIDCNGIGYFINISLYTYSKLKNDLKCKLFTHLAVREDSFTLYGFAEEEERTLFRHLISVSGIGANTARMILSSLSPNEVVNAILNKDISALQSVKGIGNKSAQRIIVDLKDKLAKKGIQEEDISTSLYNTNKEESLSALVRLGFSKNAAEKAINKVIKKTNTPLSIEQLIKQALQNL
jgi:Holliday junction DNA helicase RuvA